MKDKSEREFLARHKYTPPVLDNELRAIKRVMILAELGYTVTHEHIEHELRITRESNHRKAVQAMVIQDDC